MTIEYCLKRCDSIDFSASRYYMGRPDAPRNVADDWKNGFVSAIRGGQIPVETMDNFVHVVAYYNKNIY